MARRLGPRVPPTRHKWPVIQLIGLTAVCSPLANLVDDVSPLRFLTLVCALQYWLHLCLDLLP
jgi:hypothetical protein